MIKLRYYNCLLFAFFLIISGIILIFIPFNTNAAEAHLYIDLIYFDENGNQAPIPSSLTSSNVKNLFTVTWGNGSSQSVDALIFNDYDSSFTLYNFYMSDVRNISVYLAYSSGGISAFNYSYKPYAMLGMSSYSGAFYNYTMSQASSLQNTYNFPNNYRVYLIFSYCYDITIIDTQFGETQTYQAPANCWFGLSSPTSHIGYTFLGYFSSYSGGTGLSYIAPVTSNQTIYARWEASKYAIVLDKQGGTGGDSNVTATYNTAMPTIQIPTREGYTFNGYFTRTNGSGTKYYNSDGTSARNWTSTSGTTLYAYWTIERYNINYYDISTSDGITGTARNITYNSSLSLKTPNSRIGYTFVGWQYTVNGIEYIISNLNWTVEDLGDNNDTVNFIGQWTPRTDYLIDIKLLHPDGSESGERGTFDLQLHNGTFLQKIDNEPSSPNITFGYNWIISNITPETGMNIEKVYLSSGSGSLSPDNSTSGGPYTFIGNFTSNPKGNGEYDAVITIQLAWNTCVVNYIGNGATHGSMNSQLLVYNEASNLTANNFGKNNYVFSHWEADIDGVTKTFYDQEQILNLTTTNDNTYTFLAQWRSVSTPVGSGTQDNPFIINSIETLEFIRMQIETYVNTDNYFYKQTANIDLSDVIWIPIGKESNKFRGKYNGNGMVIENLNSLPLSKNISNVGLFGWTDSALIEKLQVINSSFSGDDNVGAIVANASVSTIIRNCILENCNIEAKQNNGAVIGNNYGTIENILVITSNCSSGNLGGQLRSSCLYQLGDIQYKTSDNINDYATWGKISNDGQAVQIELFWQAQFFEFTQNDLNSYILKN